MHFFEIDFYQDKSLNFLFNFKNRHNMNPNISKH